MELTDSYIREVETAINKRPRKRYGYHTPLNKHQELINEQNVALTY